MIASYAATMRLPSSDEALAEQGELF